MKHKHLIAFVVGTLLAAMSLMVVQTHSGRSDSLSVLWAPVWIHDTSDYGSATADPTEAENALGVRPEMISCPAVMPSLAEEVRGFPAPSLLYETGAGGGCSGHIDRRAILVVGTLLNATLYAILFLMILKRLDHTTKASQPRTRTKQHRQR